MNSDRKGRRGRRWVTVLSVSTLLFFACVALAYAGGGRGNKLKRPNDTDGDGLTNAEEAALGTNPNKWDTDGDGLSDGVEVHVTGTNPLVKDSDHDGLSDSEEASLGTDPENADTDDDGLTDGREVKLGTDPENADTDDDGIPDGEDPNPGHEDNNAFELKGTVTEVRDGCVLKVTSSDSLIDASAAKLEGAGTCDDLLNQFVQIEGEIVDGVLKAEKVEVEED